MSANGQDESDLLSRACGGDVVAFEDVVRRYQRRVYGVALRIVRRHDLADEVHGWVGALDLAEHRPRLLAASTVFPP